MFPWACSFFNVQLRSEIITYTICRLHYWLWARIASRMDWFILTSGFTHIDILHMFKTLLNRNTFLIQKHTINYSIWHFVFFLVLLRAVSREQLQFRILIFRRHDQHGVWYNLWVCIPISILTSVGSIEQALSIMFHAWLCIYLYTPKYSYQPDNSDVIHCNKYTVWWESQIILLNN